LSLIPQQLVLLLLRVVVKPDIG